MVRNSIIKKGFKSQIRCESGSGAPTCTCRAHAFHHYDLLEMVGARFLLFYARILTDQNREAIGDGKPCA